MDKRNVTGLAVMAAASVALIAAADPLYNSIQKGKLEAAAGGEEIVTVTGEGEGFEGPITAEVTLAGDRIIGLKLTGEKETPEIGGAALTALQEQIVANGSLDGVDAVSGATWTSNGAFAAIRSAMGIEEPETAAAETEPETPAETNIAASGEAPAAQLVEIEGGLQIGQAYGATHGTSCFTEAVAVVQDDTIVAAYLDDFQFLDSSAGVTGVPNSDADFAANYAEGKVLCSKRDNAEYYSKLMTEKGGATIAIDANYDAIQNFVVGKTIDELEALAGSEDAVDAVSGATLADTAGYIGVIADAAKNAKGNQAVAYSGNSENLKLSVAYAAAHGTKCFASAAALTEGDTIVLSYLDEFQFINSDAGVTGVPNSTESFGENVTGGAWLCSKRDNAAYYSEMMAEKGGSTVTIDVNYDAIQNHLNGMSIADAAALSKEDNAVDAVSGATLADTAGYVAAVAAAAEQ